MSPGFPLPPKGNFLECEEVGWRGTSQEGFLWVGRRGGNAEGVARGWGLWGRPSVGPRPLKLGLSLPERGARRPQFSPRGHGKEAEATPSECTEETARHVLQEAVPGPGAGRALLPSRGPEAGKIQEPRAAGPQVQ